MGLDEAGVDLVVVNGEAGQDGHGMLNGRSLKDSMYLSSKLYYFATKDLSVKVIMVLEM